MDPISSGQLTREEIEMGEGDSEYRLRLEESKVVLPPAAKRKGPRYTPVSRRHERPSAILWLVRNHPELKGRADTCAWSGPPRPRSPGARPHPLECFHAHPDGPGDARPVLADRTRFRGCSARPRKAVPAITAAPPCCRPPRPRARSRSWSTPKSSGDLNVDAVFAKLKTIGGKKAEEE